MVHMQECYIIRAWFLFDNNRVCELCTALKLSSSVYGWFKTDILMHQDISPFLLHWLTGMCNKRGQVVKWNLEKRQISNRKNLACLEVRISIVITFIYLLLKILFPGVVFWLWSWLHWYDSRIAAVDFICIYARLIENWICSMMMN